MKEFQVAYVPVGVPTFHLESAGEAFQKSIELLKKIDAQAVVPEEMLLSLDKLRAFLDTVSPDVIVFQNVTFANAAYMSEVLKRFSCPIVLWTLREPVIDGGRLRLNSLTGAYSASNAMYSFGREQAPYVFGAPEEESVQRELTAAIRAAKVKWQLTQLRMAAVGHTPEGFGFGRALDIELLEKFGVTLKSVEARELIELAKGYSKEEVQEYLAGAGKKMCGLEKLPQKNQTDFARLYRAYECFVKEHHIGALSSRCWPDFFTSFGTPVCAVLAMLNDMGIPASCEADTYGALSMYIGRQLSEKPVFFGDPVSLDEQENTITYWHCGTAACSLAREDSGAAVGVHCNRKIGPTLDFGCRPWDNITVFRIGKKPEGSFRFFIMEGRALDKPKQFTGTSVVVQPKNDAREIVRQSVVEGFEPHFCVVYGSCATELTMLAGMLGMEVCRY
ncbi:MAG: fucose isomerase [Clostridiales bacterium]|nr:fucose isomerase [Roseburia sp.]MDD7635788.1 fucose isomerase [Clostridiales bacterium]MDY4112119.1 fucose isomerase [Roseburia sp.]